jgi:hypothetical protein
MTSSSLSYNIYPDPVVIEVLIPGPPGTGLPAGTGDAGKFVRKAGTTAYAYELVTPDQVGLPQGLSSTSSPTFAGLTLGGMAPSVGSLLLVGANGQLTTVLLGSNLSITAGVLNASGGGGAGSVTSVGLSVPTGFAVSNSPVTASGTLALTFATGYSLPTNARQATWDAKADLVNGVVPSSQIPAIAISEYLGAVGSQAAMLALTGQRGDWCLRTDSPAAGMWVLGADNSALLSSWVQIPVPTVPVQSVNGQTGIITLGPGDVGAATAAQGALASTAVQPSVTNALTARLDAFRDAQTFYVSKRITASDSNNGTSPGEPFLTIGAAVSAANSYIAANPTSLARIEVGPGTFTEGGLPFRLRPNILARGAAQRGTIIKPATGQELNGFFALDSGDMLLDFRFAGHQATGTSDTDSSVGTRAWAVRFNEQANGGQGPIIYASPYVKDCASITAEDDDGLAGSTSTGDTGGGIEIDGAKVHPNSPVRSMVVYGYTQQNLGGPGVIVKNDAYAELVSFFGLFCTWHVQCETGGWATLSGGGCSEFGIYGVVADGYSSTALYTGSLRVAASSGATSVDVVSLTSNRLGSSSRPHNGQIMLLGGTGYVVTSSSPINSSGTVVADSDGTRAGYRVSLYNPTGAGLVASAVQGATADFRRRSQVSAGCHTALFVGSGTNYSALPWNGGVPIRANQFVERNFGKVFGLSVNDAGDISAAGGAFAVDGTSGSVTINTSSFNLSGLNAVGPFSRNGGISTVGVQLQEVSNNVTLLSSTGSSDGNTAPTQFAVRSYGDNRYLAGLTVTSGQPISISDTSTQDGSGYWTRSRNITLTLNAPNGLARLDSSGLIPSSLLPSYVDDVLEYANLASFPATGESGKIYVSLATGLTYRWGGSSYVEISASPGSTDAVVEGSVNLYYTNARARAAISATGSISYNPTTGVFSYTAPTLAAVATTGAYSDLTGRPTLGTAAGAATGDFLPTTFSAGTITYAATTNLDMAAHAGTYKTISLTGDLTFTTSNRASGRTVTLRLICDATQRTLTFPAGWVFVGTKPSNIAASKTAVLSLTFFGTADTDCVAAYGVQT